MSIDIKNDAEAIQAYGGGPIGVSPDTVVPLMRKFAFSEIELAVSFKRAPGVTQVSLKGSACGGVLISGEAETVDLVSGFYSPEKRLLRATFFLNGGTKAASHMVTVDHEPDGRTDIQYARIHDRYYAHWMQIADRARE